MNAGTVVEAEHIGQGVTSPNVQVAVAYPSDHIHFEGYHVEIALLFLFILIAVFVFVDNFGFGVHADAPHKTSGDIHSFRVFRGWELYFGQ